MVNSYTIFCDNLIQSGKIMDFLHKNAECGWFCRILLIWYTITFAWKHPWNHKGAFNYYAIPQIWPTALPPISRLQCLLKIKKMWSRFVSTDRQIRNFFQLSGKSFYLHLFPYYFQSVVIRKKYFKLEFFFSIVKTVSKKQYRSWVW